MQQLFSVTIGTVVDIITIATVVIVNFYRQIIEPVIISLPTYHNSIKILV